MDKEFFFTDLKNKIETFCHRNFITSEFNLNSRKWKINFSEASVNVVLSKNFLKVTFFAVVTNNVASDLPIKLGLYEKLLKANANLIGPAFSLSPNDEILLTYTRSIEDLDYNDLSYLILATRKNLSFSSTILAGQRSVESSAASGKSKIDIPTSVAQKPVPPVSVSPVAEKSNSDFDDQDDWDF